jgi:hypothetical protein
MTDDNWTDQRETGIAKTFPDDKEKNTFIKLHNELFNIETGELLTRDKTPSRSLSLKMVSALAIKVKAFEKSKEYFEAERETLKNLISFVEYQTENYMRAYYKETKSKTLKLEGGIVLSLRQKGTKIIFPEKKDNEKAFNFTVKWGLEHLPAMVKTEYSLLKTPVNENLNKKLDLPPNTEVSEPEKGDLSFSLSYPGKKK